MQVGQSLSQNLSQQLKLSPQLQQSLQILQAPTLELEHMITQELAANPVLEADMQDVSLEQERPEEQLNEDSDFDREFSQLSAMDDEWRNYLSQSATTTHRTSEDEERRQFLFDSLTTPVTLQQHLVEQLALADLSPEQREHVELLIGLLDERGFLPAKLGDLSIQYSVPLDDLQTAQEVLLSFEPVGIGAEDLRQCLLVQLERAGRGHSLEARILDHHLDDLAQRRLPLIARKLAVPLEDISRATENIAKLNPRPAAAFSIGTQQFVIADVKVERQQGGFSVTLNDERVPRLRISNLYKDLMNKPGEKADVREYIREKIRGGKFLIRSIEQRQQTIRRIAEEIVSRQQDFFDYGPTHLKPMNMAQVAEVVGVHETTVSRAVSGKYMDTPHGLFEMRHFFAAAMSTDTGEQVANTSVKTVLAEVIKGEDTSKPWSDEQLEKQMVARGYMIKRRTIAKYREELGILPSHLRKRY